ncbi:MAG: TetR/AcrR family transcriptional regulator [Ramlibacter sp.]
MSQSTARFRDKREAILDGAARMFNQHGVKGGMISDIARSVGLATNSLTYYYRKKEDLVAACLLRSVEAMCAAADAAAGAGTQAERVRGFIARYLGLLAEIGAGQHPELIVFSDLLTVTAPHDAAVVAAYNEMFRRVRRLLDVGTPAAQDAAARNARAHLLLSSVSWARAWLLRYEPQDYPRVAARIADILLYGIGTHALQPAAAPPQLQWNASGDAVDSATREAYLRAATRLVNQHGYHGASVDRIAAVLQLTKGSFYHHHETKEELIAACFERTFGVMRAAQAAALAASGSGLDRLALACRALLAFQMSPDGPLLRVTAWTGLPDPLRSETRRTMGRLGERFATLVIDGMDDGSVRVVDPSIAAQVINGMVNAAAELERWARGIDAANVFELYAMPVFTGLQSAAGATAAPAPRTPARIPMPG